MLLNIFLKALKITLNKCYKKCLLADTVNSTKYIFLKEKNLLFAHAPTDFATKVFRIDESASTTTTRIRIALHRAIKTSVSAASTI